MFGVTIAAAFIRETAKQEKRYLCSIRLSAAAASWVPRASGAPLGQGGQPGARVGRADAFENFDAADCLKLRRELCADHGVEQMRF